MQRSYTRRLKQSSLYKRLWTKQKRVTREVVERDATALFAEQRTGKTYITAAVIDVLKSDTFSALGIVPLTNIETSWVTQLEKVEGLTICRSWETFEEASRPRLLLIHWQALPKLTKYIARERWSFKFVDESQYAKSRNGNLSRALARVAEAKKKVILSGTPVDKGLEHAAQQDPQELWSQWRFLDPSVFGTVWKDFEEEYLRPCGYMGYGREFRPARLKPFIRRVSPYIIRLTKKDVGIPAPRFVRCPVLLSGKQRSLYRTLEQDMVATVRGSSTVTAELKITQLAKLQQITGGHVKDDDERIRWVGDAKLRRLLKLLEKYRPPAVIFCRYLEEIRQIVEELDGHKVEAVTGENRKQRTGILEAFQAGELDYLVCQVKTGGVGIELWRANYGVFYSSTFSFIDFDQAYSRLQVRGKGRVPFYLLYCKGTIDEDIYNAAREKKSVNEMFYRRVRKSR